jgi:hypothetical protein
VTSPARLSGARRRFCRLRHRLPVEQTSNDDWRVRGENRADLERLAINGFEVHVSADEDGILAQIAKGNIFQTETCFGWNDKHDNGRRSLIGSSARRWHYRLGLDSAGIVTKWSVSVCRNVTMSLSSWLVSPRLPIKWDTLVGVSGGGQQLTFSPGEN